MALEPRLRATLFGYVKNKNDVEDVLQATYERLLDAGESPVEEVRHVPAFIFATLRHEALNFIRSRRRAVAAEVIAELENVDDGTSVEEFVNTQQEIDLLGAAVEQLSTRRRLVYVMREVHGYSRDEVAEKLGISKATVHQHGSKAGQACLQALLLAKVSQSFLQRVFPRRTRRKGEGRT
jgi:RNA polymerase sigma-70 factor (ECF subfamily)